METRTIWIAAAADYGTDKISMTLNFDDAKFRCTGIWVTTSKAARSGAPGRVTFDLQELANLNNREISMSEKRLRGRQHAPFILARG